MGLVGDGIEYVNPSSKKDGYKLIQRRSDRSVVISREDRRDWAKRRTTSSGNEQVKKMKNLATEGNGSVTVE